MPKTLAIFSPAQNAYSETFIQAHRNLPFNIKYYYDGYLPQRLEGVESIQHFSIAQRIKKKFDKRFNLSEAALLQSLKKEKVDCILAEYGPTGCKSLKVASHLKIPLVVHFHGYDASIITIVQEYKEEYTKIFSYASSIIAVSNKMRETLLSLGCPPHKLIKATYGPSNIFFDVQPDYNSQQFVGVGRFVEKKGHIHSISAFKKVVDIFPQATLVLIGEGEFLNHCKYMVKIEGLTKNVIFLGVQSSQEIQSIFKKSIAFIQHSITAADGDSEGTPVAILEAMAASLPVISTNHAGIPEVVLHEQTGLLCDELDVDGMAMNMIQILKDNGLAKQLGKAGKSQILHHFTIEKHLQIIENTVLNACIEKH